MPFYSPRAEGHTPDKTGGPDEPWLTRASIVFIASLLSKSSTKVLEFGSRSSTIWFAKRCLRVDSVEHSLDWKAQVDREMARLGLRNAMVHYGRETDSYREYIALGRQIALDRGPFDVILVDGRERVQCVEAVHASVALGGYLILDDSERAKYARVRDLLSAWSAIETSNGIWSTTIFRKPVMRGYDGGAL